MVALRRIGDYPYCTVSDAAGPVIRYNAETFWLQGINLGLRLEY